MTRNSFTVLDITSTNSFSACNDAITVSSSGSEDVGIRLDKQSAWLNLFYEKKFHFVVQQNGSPSLQPVCRMRRDTLFRAIY